MQQFGIFLANLRSNSALNLNELASLVQTSRSSISRLENDQIPRPFRGKVRQQLLSMAEILCTSTKENERFLELAGMERTLLTEKEEILLGFTNPSIFQSEVTTTDLEQIKNIYEQHIEHLKTLDEQLQAILALKPRNTNIRQSLQQKLHEDTKNLETIQLRLERFSQRESMKGVNTRHGEVHSSFEDITKQPIPDHPNVALEQGRSQTYDTKHIEFFEEHVLMLWQLYRVGGTNHLSSYLNTWFRELESFIKSLQGGGNHKRALVALCMSFLLKGTLAADKALYQQAHQIYQQALDIAIETNDAELIGSALTRIGGLLMLEEKYSEASPFLNSALDTIRGLNSSKLRGTILEILAEISVRTQQINSGRRYIELAENMLGNLSYIQERGQFLFDSATLLARQATIALLTRDYKAALALTDKSLAICKPTSIRTRARLLAQKAEALYSMDEINECVKNAEEGLVLAGAVESSKNIALIRNLYAMPKASPRSKEPEVNQLAIMLTLY